MNLCKYVSVTTVLRNRVCLPQTEQMSCSDFLTIHNQSSALTFSIVFSPLLVSLFYFSAIYPVGDLKYFSVKLP